MVRDQGEAGRQGHLDHGGFAVAHDSPLRGDGISQRAGDLGGEVTSAGGVDEGGEGAVAAVGHRNQYGFSLRDGSPDAALDGNGGGAGGDALLERLGSDDDSEGHG